ncbi:hypothetical protein [Blastococcus sp. CCUG 61487]|nr:hypothetical protein [Blastococcus sp. CCUG 61487]
MLIWCLTVGALSLLGIGAAVRLVYTGNPGPLPTLDHYATRAPLP